MNAMLKLSAGIAAGVLVISAVSASAETAAPTREEALAALERIEQESDTIREYLEADTATTPTPTGTTDPTPVPTTPAPTGTAPAGRASGLTWSSGVNPQPQTAEQVTSFATFRGAPVDNVTLFPPRDNWSTMSDPQWIEAGLPESFDPARDDLVMTIPLWPGNMSVGNTGSKTQWENLANVIEASDPDAYVRLGWEMNLSGSYWNLNNSNKTQWVSSYRTAVNHMKAVAPDLRFVWNPNKGGDQTSGCSGTTCSRSAFQSLKDVIDVYGIDSYDSWPALTNDSASATHLNNLLGESLAYAKANGKKFAVPEWGLGCNTPGCQWQGNAGGDNPRYISEYMAFFATHAEDLAFESYFNEPDSYIRSALNVSPIGASAPAVYRTAVCTRTTQC